MTGAGDLATEDEERASQSAAQGIFMGASLPTPTYIRVRLYILQTRLYPETLKQPTPRTLKDHSFTFKNSIIRSVTSCSRNSFNKKIPLKIPSKIRK